MIKKLICKLFGHRSLQKIASYLSRDNSVHVHLHCFYCDEEITSEYDDPFKDIKEEDNASSED